MALWFDKSLLNANVPKSIALESSNFTSPGDRFVCCANKDYTCVWSHSCGMLPFWGEVVAAWYLKAFLPLKTTDWWPHQFGIRYSLWLLFTCIVKIHLPICFQIIHSFPLEYMHFQFRWVHSLSVCNFNVRYSVLRGSGNLLLVGLSLS